MKIYNQPLPSNQAWPRSYLVRILEAASRAKEYNFIRQTSLDWLASYPGDLPVKIFQVDALIENGLSRQALPIIQHLVRIDPESSRAHELLSKAIKSQGHKQDDQSKNSLQALANTKKYHKKKKSQNETWGPALSLIRYWMDNGEYNNALEGIQNLIGQEPDIPLIGITHLRILRSQKDTPQQSIRKLAEHYNRKWPDTLQFILLLAECLMNGSDSERAVALLHTAASKDITGQVATRLWGENHPYEKLWPDELKAYITTQIPSGVSSQLGWNLLPPPTQKNRRLNGIPVVPESLSTKIKKLKRDGTQSSEKESPLINNVFIAGRKPKSRDLRETLTSVESELEADQQRKRSANADGLFPVYVIFTTKKGLQKKYGERTTEILDESLRNLTTALRKRLDWGSTLIYADDPASMAQFGLKPAVPDDPWKLKLALVDLDDALATRGARIGAVLIIGDSQVVPFHNLPNPTDDSDNEIPSDNPYATRDENYFIPEWSVGRLPGGSGRDPGLLISTLRTMTESHSQEPRTPVKGIISFILWLINLILKSGKKSQKSFGYSAEVWKDVSSSIFRTIGNRKSMITSPPDEGNRSKMIQNVRLGYFNLHGVVDSAEWFGQRDPRKRNDGPEYPIALQPKDIPNGGSAPQVVFSEACYGANIHKKQIEDAIALKFLASGSQVVIGSTVISYGSINPPLNAADLLGKVFWQNFMEGMPAGEALRRAKIALATEMHERQGYLDGEDQKTLISFVLYGDPLAQVEKNKDDKYPKILNRVTSIPRIKTVCDRAEIQSSSESISREMVGQIKEIVEQYLPGMQDADLILGHEHAECCCEGHFCPTAQLGNKTRLDHEPERQVVTLSKQIVRSRQIHKKFARVTLDKEGNLVKLTVSR
jgi:hypothetical protein